MISKFELNNVSFGIALYCAVLVAGAVIIEWYSMSVLYAVIGLSSLFMGETGAVVRETVRKAVYGIAVRFSGNYIFFDDGSIVSALAQAKADAEVAEAKAEADDAKAVAEAEAKAWRDLMVTHVVSAAALLSVDYELISGLGLRLSVHYGHAGGVEVRLLKRLR